MSDLQKNIDRPDIAPIQQIPSVSPIEKDKQGENRPSYEEEEKEATLHPYLLATVFSYLKRIIISLTHQKKTLSSQDIQELYNDLLLMKEYLLRLEFEDESRNPDFLETLSSLWNKFLIDFNPMEIKEGKNKLFITQLKEFVNQISHYPSGEEHSLGFYLAQHVGSEWIPFPFMDMLQDLHLEHEKKQENSSLHQWVRLLEDIIESVSGKNESTPA